MIGTGDGRWCVNVCAVGKNCGRTSAQRFGKMTVNVHHCAVMYRYANIFEIESDRMRIAFNRVFVDMSMLEGEYPCILILRSE